MENCNSTSIKDEPVFEDYFFTIQEVSEDEEPLKEPQKEFVIPVSEPNYSVKCEICNKGFLPKDLKIHLATAHLTTTKCLECLEYFPSTWYLARHRAICNAGTNQNDEELNMDCKRCSKQFLSIWDLKLHATACKLKPTKRQSKIKKVTRIYRQGKITSFLCSVCDKEFKNKVSYVRHKHSNSFRSVCRIDVEN